MSDLPPADALAGVHRVRVGTTNRPKIAAVQAALALYRPAVKVDGVAVESGVPDQPVGLPEISRGARNRAHAAFDGTCCELAIGIEDGLVILRDVHPEPFNIGCAVITDGHRESVGLSSAFPYPSACAEPALERREPIGELFDDLWRQRTGEQEAQGSGLSVGNVGKLSLGMLTRAEYARHAVLCALVRFLHPDLYFGDDAGGPGFESFTASRSAGAHAATPEESR